MQEALPEELVPAFRMGTAPMRATPIPSMKIMAILHQIQITQISVQDLLLRIFIQSYICLFHYLPLKVVCNENKGDQEDGMYSIWVLDSGD